jgi:outer membrane protein assembly factor BamB
MQTSRTRHRAQRQSSCGIGFWNRRAILWALLCCQSNIFAGESRLSWPFRNGPGLNSQVAARDAKGLPSEFDEQSGKNVKWKVPLQGHGHSTPVIGAGRIWLTAATEDGKQQFVYCLDADSGNVLHHKLVFKNEDPEPLGQKVNTYASPSCALQDDAVYAHFGSYGTVRLSTETAEVVWQRRDIKCRHFRGPGSSPMIFQDLLILTFDGIDRQFLMAIDKHSGKTVWRTNRSTDYGDLDADGNPKREGDLRKAYSTPGFVEVNGRTQVVSVGSRGAYGYDVLTGKEVWGIRHGDFNAAAPPAFYNDIAILHSGSGGRNLFGVHLNETTKGDVTESHVRWNRTQGNPRLSAPILVGNRVYMITDKGVASCIAADTGEEIWKDRVGGTHVASPVSANGLIYFCSEEGDTTAIRASDKFEIVARNRLAEGMRASPAAANGRLYLRTFGHLYCIEEAQSASQDN